MQLEMPVSSLKGMGFLQDKEYYQWALKFLPEYNTPFFLLLYPLRKNSIFLTINNKIYLNDPLF